ncbi:MAG: transglutaminase-like domain-containing protein [Tannerellaceae bacterium]|jgi:transglutaminase-like putative cysteine protease|nr:transglutaminase-like domain-containing protein [Tannerellaceae bacterium]
MIPAKIPSLPFIVFVLLSLVFMGCGGRQSASDQLDVLPDDASLQIVKADFDRKVEAMPSGNLFDSCYSEAMTLPERKAMMFLYAYMPAGDVTDYGAGFYLRNVRASFLARKEMPWGDSIPVDIFRHFVLPLRVNNEALDDSRTAFYSELKNRVRGLTLSEAALEVNHWCHEKVVYAPSDSRTSSPLATLRSAVGRCGEESVFAVAALRSVGIPARQVYTPRWAHTDDNHAWVEVWVDGRWHFMGACEPAPVLDMAWFNAPARRSMLMHAKVFGRYVSADEVMDQTDCYTEINVTANYAPTALSTVTVLDAAGRPQPGAVVEFKLYNYAEFYTVARRTSDSLGQASLTTGRGDLIVWASHAGRFGFGKVSAGSSSNASIALKYMPGDAIDLSLDIVPPPEGEIGVEVSESQKASNALRLAAEDSIRNLYSAEAFCTVEKATSIALDDADLIPLLRSSRANWPELAKLIAEGGSEGKILLKVISQKDLRDASFDILIDHAKNSGPNDDLRYPRFILNPRIANEMLTPYKSYFQQNVPQSLADAIRQDPQQLVKWTSENIRLADNLNPHRIPISPAGVWRSRTADAHSRNIFFVALLRSLRIPARINAVTGKVQYSTVGDWVSVDFESTSSEIASRGSLAASYKPIRGIDNPRYYSHFSIARISADGQPSTLNFEAQAQTDMGDGDTWMRLLRDPMPIDPGNYVIITGTRMARGNVLAHVRSFAVRSGQITTTALSMRENPDDIQVIGSLDAELLYRDAVSGQPVSLLSTSGRGYYIAALIAPNHEPSTHLLRELSAQASAFDAWGRRIIIMFQSDEEALRFDTNALQDLPATIAMGVDNTGLISRALATSLKWDGSLPAIVIADTFGRIVFFSQGYSIGSGARLLETIRKL